MNFSDKGVVVTGGSRGFGRALAEAFLGEDAKVVISGNDADELKATAKAIGADYFVADAASPKDTMSLADHVTDRFGKIDVWINNAGIQIAPSPVESVSIDRLHDLFAVNFFGYFNGCMAALRKMKPRNEGLIINVNSTAGLSGKPGLSAYVSSKFAIRGLSETIRQEVKGSGIQVYQLFPGGMQTDIYQEATPSDIGDYMRVDDVVKKVMDNLRLDNPDPDLIIRRPTH